MFSRCSYKGCTRLAAASDKVYQLLAHGRWFSPGTPASSTTKTGRHDIAEILLKVALNTKNQSICSLTFDLFQCWMDLLINFARQRDHAWELWTCTIFENIEIKDENPAISEHSKPILMGKCMIFIQSFLNKMCFSRIKIEY